MKPDDGKLIRQLASAIRALLGNDQTAPGYPVAVEQAQAALQAASDAGYTGEG